MVDRHGQDFRWYRLARRTYGLPAGDALAYSRDRAAVWSSDFRWGYDVDTFDDDSLVVYVVDTDGETVDSLGGVTVPYWVSDHGNVHTDNEEPFLVGLVADMVRNIA